MKPRYRIQRIADLFLGGIIYSYLVFKFGRYDLPKHLRLTPQGLFKVEKQ